MAGIYPDSGVPAGQATNTVDVDTVNCDNGELFYSTSRCQPRFDPAAANAVISEILNVVKCAGNEYDCSRLDNLCLAIEQIIVNACLDVPDLGEICGGAETLVLYTDPDDPTCQRLGRISSDSRKSVIAGPESVWTHVPPDATGYVIPDNLPAPANYYDGQAYQADGGTNTAPYQGGKYGPGVREAAGLNAGRISNSRYAVFDITIPCNRSFSIVYNFTRDASQPVTDYTTVNNATTHLTYRVRYYDDDLAAWTPWLYPFQATQGILAFHTSFTGVLPHNQFETGGITFYAGRFQLEFFYVGGAGGVTTALKLAANTFVAGESGAPIPRVTLVPILVG